MIAVPFPTEPPFTTSTTFRKLRILAVHDRRPLPDRTALHHLDHVQEALLLYDLLHSAQRLRHAAVEAPGRDLVVKFLVHLVVLLDLRGLRRAAPRRALRTRTAPRRGLTLRTGDLRGPRPRHAQ